MNLPNSFPVHILVLLLCIPASILLLKTLKQLKYAGIMVSLIICLLLLLVNIVSFSIVYIIDYFDGELISIQLYNYWSLFLRTHASATILRN